MLFDLCRGRVVEIELGFFRVRDEFGVFHRCGERAAQNFQPFFRRSRWKRKRTGKFVRRVPGRVRPQVSGSLMTCVKVAISLTSGSCQFLLMIKGMSSSPSLALSMVLAVVRIDSQDQQPPSTSLDCMARRIREVPP